MTATVGHFFIVGGQRCGTSYLCQLLDEHPCIEMAKPFRPEPKYFLGDRSNPPDGSGYVAAYFGAKPDATMRGEKSTSYMESREAAARIASMFPAAKIVLVLRDPVERALSHYRLSVSSGFETLSIEDAFRREDERRDEFDPTLVSVSPYAYVSRGRYIESVTLYEEFFPAGQISVLLYEELVRNVSTVQDLYGFLGVAANFVPPTAGRPINQSVAADQAVPAAALEYARARLAEPTARLARHLGRDLARWWKIDGSAETGSSSS